MKAVVAAVAAALVSLALVPVAPAAVAPVPWCGSDQVSTDRNPDFAGGPQIHVIYAIPADGQNRFAELASPLATDVAAIDAWWRAQDASRAPRFDLVDIANCPSRFGQLDITVARLPNGTGFYGDLPEGFVRIAQALGAAPFNFTDATKKHLVFYDGEVNDAEEGLTICGIANGSPNSGGAASYALTFLRSGCGLEAGGGRSNALVAAHELLHMLGAVPRGAPSTCPGDDGHVCDSDVDILYPFLSFSLLDQVVLDVNRNQYYGHGGGWFDVQDSAWLLSAQSQAVLTTDVYGRGTLRFAESSRTCTQTCRTEWNAGAQVILQAIPESGERFAGWSGACTGSAASCTVTVDAAKTVTARFRTPLTLTVRVTGRGVVTSTPRGISCPRACTRQVFAGDSVTLRATARLGWRFTGWRGLCRGTRATCTVRPAASGSVSAVFRRRA